MEVFSLTSLLLFFLLSYLYIFFITNFFFKTYSFLTQLPEFIKNRHRFLDWTTEILSQSPTNTMHFRRSINIHGIITANPSNVEHILKTNFHNYPKGDRFIYTLQDLLGRGIFNSDGDLWKHQRKTASFEFNTKSLRNFIICNVKNEIETRFLPFLINSSQTHRVFDLQNLLECFAFDNICKIAFNVDPSALSCASSPSNMAVLNFTRAFDNALSLIVGRFLYVPPFLWKIMKLINIGSEYELKKSISTVHKFTENIIRLRIESHGENKDNDDLLSRFIANNNENSVEFLRDIVISFILAGRDTTSSSLTWFFWILSSRPDVERNILNELKSIRKKRNGVKNGDSTVTNTNTVTYDLDELRQMHYLHAAISEAMRLYPPVAIDTKYCREDDIMPDGTFIGKGGFVVYNAYAMGRMESIWGKDCREFKPERWLEENGTFRPENPFRFPIFNGGPRMCLGKDMAYTQMKSIAALVIEMFEMDVVDKDTCPDSLFSLTLRMKRGLLVRVKERSCVDGGVVDS